MLTPSASLAAPGPRCPFPDVDCRFQHRSNPTRLTCHWLGARPSTPIPKAMSSTQDSRRNTSQARNICPFENCRFTHQHSVSILNDYICTHHAEQSLPETIIIPWQMRPCRNCNRFVCSRAEASHVRTFPAQQHSSDRHATSSRPTTITSFFSSARQPDPQGSGIGLRITR